jgi:hypothetical protein
MLLPDAIALCRRLIKTGEKHQDYERTVELAKKYRRMITGKNIELDLHQFVQRETKEMFDQRMRITRSITPAVAASLRTPFRKVARNTRIRSGFKVGTDKGREQAVAEMIKGFYGSRKKKHKGLDYWMRTRFTNLQFTDPNTWVVTEWDAAKDSERVQPRPFEVPAAQAVNFLVVNDETKWLLIQQPINFKSLDPNASKPGVPINPNNAPGVVYPAGLNNAGCRWTLYDEDFTVVFEQIDREYNTMYSVPLANGATIEEVDGKHYIVTTYRPNLGYAPAFRIGYNPDDETDQRTYVNPWHDALCFFDKTLKVVSELDLTMTMHAFPQKIAYIQRCQGETREKKCQDGKTMDGNTCKACNGSGFKVHKTAQDALYLPMPKEKDQMMDLDKLIAYKSPPIDLIKFQNEYALQLERQAHQAVFNSQVFVRKTNTGDIVKTATEADYNMESVYDALDPFTEKYSEVWREFVITFARLANEPIESIDVSHEFLDYKLKTSNMLQTERKVAIDAGAPAFIIEAIDDDLASQVYAGDEMGKMRYVVKRRFFPFLGKSPDEIADAAASQFVPKAAKVLYFNFEAIFRELEWDTPNFYMKTLAQQRVLVAAKVQEYITTLNGEAPTLTGFNRLGAGPAGTEENEPGDEGNPGNTNNEDDANDDDTDD